MTATSLSFVSFQKALSIVAQFAIWADKPLEHQPGDTVSRMMPSSRASELFFRYWLLLALPVMAVDGSRDLKCSEPRT
jgi:hypothetical protein